MGKEESANKMKLAETKAMISESVDVDFTDNQDKLDWLEAYYIALENREDFIEKRERDLRNKGILANHTYVNGQYIAPKGYTTFVAPSRWKDNADVNIYIRDDKAKDSHYVERVRSLYKTLQKIRTEQDSIKKRIKYARKDVARDKLVAMDGGKRKKYVPQNIDPSQYPLHFAGSRRAPRTVGRRRGRGGIRIAGRMNYITNPIRETGATNLYVGPPLDYPDLSTPMKLVFVQLDELLTELGHESFTVLYGARIQGAITFLAIGAKGKVKWYKRSNPLKNMLYLNETAYDANWFLKRSKDKRLKELEIYIGKGPNKDKAQTP